MKDQDSQSVSYDEIIAELNISKATIRNWLKLGHFVACGKNKIERRGYVNFCRDVIGTQKLAARANKTQHRNANVPNFILPAWEVLIAMPEAELGQLAQDYEASLSQKHRNIKGVYYTPPDIAREMFSNAVETAGKTFLDPCCGTGNFLLAALDAGFAPADVYGFDIDENAILLAKARIYKKTKRAPKNIQHTDYLQSTHEMQLKADYIFTNPPWGAKLPIEIKGRLTKALDLPKTADTSAIFTAVIIGGLKQGGIAGLLLPDAFFNISAFAEIRRKILRHKIVSIKDYGRAFSGLLTKAQAIIIANEVPNSDTRISCEFTGKNYKRKQCDFANNPNQIFNFYCNGLDAEIIAHLYKQPHKTTKNNAKWALGIVTGDNKRHILKQPKAGAIPIFKGNDITPNGLKQPSNWIVPNFEKFQQTAPQTLYDAPEKIVYRFISSNLCFGYDDAQRLFLNSANILIPDPKLGISAANLTKLLNTNLLNWLFTKIFNTPKVLRGDLETLPLFVEQFEAAGFEENEAFYKGLGVRADGNGGYERAIK